MKQDLERLWEEHTSHEFATRDTESTIATMVDDAHVNHVPVMTGGYGKEALRAFYSRDFIPCMPPDTKLTPVSRTIGESQLVDEMIFSFTHTQEMPWMLPGVPPTHRFVEIPLVAIIGFRDGKLVSEQGNFNKAVRGRNAGQHPRHLLRVGKGKDHLIHQLALADGPRDGRKFGIGGHTGDKVP